jgi:hypothetical protein
LKTAGADIISDPIARAAIAFSLEDQTKRADQPEAINHAARLVRFLQLTHNNSALAAARTIAESSSDPEVLAACLQLLNSEEDLEVIRACLNHEFCFPIRNGGFAIAQPRHCRTCPRCVVPDSSRFKQNNQTALPATCSARS